MIEPIRFVKTFCLIFNKKKVVLKYSNSANSVGGDSSVSFEDSFADFESVKWPSRPEPVNDSHLAQNFEPSHGNRGRKV